MYVCDKRSLDIVALPSRVSRLGTASAGRHLAPCRGRFNELLAEFQMAYDLDLTRDYQPPEDLYVRVNVLQDIGQCVPPLRLASPVPQAARGRCAAPGRERGEGTRNPPHHHAPLRHRAAPRGGRAVHARAQVHRPRVWPALGAQAR